MEKFKEFKKASLKRFNDFLKLREKNDKLRGKIDKILNHWEKDLPNFDSKIDKKEIWIWINSLIENELQQEEMCGE